MQNMKTSSRPWRLGPTGLNALLATCWQLRAGHISTDMLVQEERAQHKSALELALQVMQDADVLWLRLVEVKVRCVCVSECVFSNAPSSEI